MTKSQGVVPPRAIQQPVCFKLWLPMPYHRRHPLRYVALLSKRYEPPRFEADFSILCLVQTR
jgi:hypothetical protein